MAILRTGDFVSIGDRIVRANEVYYEVNEKKEKKVSRIDFYIVDSQRCLEVELIYNPKIGEIFSYEVYGNCYEIRRVNKDFSSSPLCSEVFEVVFRKQRTQAQPKVTSIACNSVAGVSVCVDVEKLSAARNLAYITRLKSKEKQARAIMFSIGVLRKKGYEGLHDAVRESMKIGLRINRNEFFNIRNLYNEKRVSKLDKYIN